MESDNYKLIAALAFGAMGGLILGRILWGSPGREQSLSKHLATLSKVMEQLEELNTFESEHLKEKIENIISTFESSYGNAKESNK